jgi:hypothetical protein
MNLLRSVKFLATPLFQKHLRKELKRSSECAQNAELLFDPERKRA